MCNVECMTHTRLKPDFIEEKLNGIEWFGSEVMKGTNVQLHRHTNTKPTHTHTLTYTDAASRPKSRIYMCMKAAASYRHAVLLPLFRCCFFIRFIVVVAVRLLFHSSSF